MRIETQRLPIQQFRVSEPSKVLLYIQALIRASSCLQPLSAADIFPTCHHTCFTSQERQAVEPKYALYFLYEKLLISCFGLSQMIFFTAYWIRGEI
jgi:hypothetical protein